MALRMDGRKTAQARPEGGGRKIALAFQFRRLSREYVDETGLPPEFCA